MFSFSSSITINPIYNPYYFYAGSSGGLYTDRGWTVYFVGASGRDIFRGDNFRDYMWGYGDNDRLEGMGGNDVLYGGDGDDTLLGGLGADELYGGYGIDTASYEDGTSRVIVNLSVGVGFSGEASGDTYHSIENVTGTRWNDLIVGNSSISGNTIDGGDGDDMIYGEGGNDVIRGGGGNDVMFGGQGVDVFEWTHYTLNGVGTDVIRDFDVDDELLRFRFDDTATAAWTASEEVYQGRDGLMLVLTEEQANGPFARYDVFLDGVTLAEFSADNIEFY